MPETIDAEVLSAVAPDDVDWSVGIVRRDDGTIQLRYNNPHHFLLDTQVMELGDDVEEAEARLDALAEGLREEGA